MKQEEALKMVEEFLRTHGLYGDQTEDLEELEKAVDEGRNEDSFAGGDPDVSFRFDSDSGELKCFALIYEFSDDPKEAVLEACREEADSGSTEMGGGTLEYDPGDKGLYLTRSYKKGVAVSQLTSDLAKLQEASILWGEEVLDRVASKVYQT